MLGSHIAGAAYSPRTVYLEDLDQDNKTDVVVVSPAKKIVFFQVEDGLFKTLEDKKEFEQKSLENKVNDKTSK